MVDEMRSLSDAETDAVFGGALVITMTNTIVTSVVGDLIGTAGERTGDEPVN